MNIADNVRRSAIFFPDNDAIIFEGRTITYRRLNRQVDQLANALAANGFGKGTCIGLYLPNIPEFAVSYLAAVRVGAIAVSINAMYKAGELDYILNDAGIALVFTTAELVANIPFDRCPNLKQAVICEGQAGDHPALSQWLEKASDRPAGLRTDPADPAVLLYTSGTTGFPKGATLSHANVVSNSWSAVHHCGYRPDDRMLMFLPVFHVFGQNHIMNATFTAGAALVLHRRFVADPVIASLQADRVSRLFAVPTIYIALLSMDLPDAVFTSVRYEFSAASTMPREISARWTERFGRPVFEGYGLTESSPFACYNHEFRHKFGSVGTPVENTEIKIVDESDNEVALGKWGEICIRGPGVMLGYWNKPEETRQALAGGWLHSGDIGMIDDEGYVFIVDRVKDMINVAGFKVWPAEIEQFLYKHPAIKEVAVYGRPDPHKGEMTVAAVVLNEGATATAEQIIAYCRENLAVYKAPAKVDFVSELPKSPTGKILKRVLREG